jgi:hypothetical protein
LAAATKFQSPAYYVRLRSATEGSIASIRDSDRQRWFAVSALAAGALVSIALGAYARTHRPSAYALGVGSPVRLKVWLTWLISLLACLQLLSGLRIIGRIRWPRGRPRWLRRAHRVSGAFAFLLALPVAYDCMRSYGFQTTSLRVGLHSAVGCFFLGAFATKLLAVQGGRRAWFLVPAVGGALFASLLALWATSSFWYFARY